MGTKLHRRNRILSAKLRAHNTQELKAMVSGLRGMGRGGQNSLLKLIEEEIRRRQGAPTLW